MTGIHRTRFIRRCIERGLQRNGGDGPGHTMFFRVPIENILWWDPEDEAVCILPNTMEALAVSTRRASAVAVFTRSEELDLALTTYDLLNP